MKTTKDHYINQFQQRIKEIELYRGMLFNLYNNTKSEIIKVKCISEMMKTTEDLVYLYDMLPSIGARVSSSSSSSSSIIDNNNFILKKWENNKQDKGSSSDDKNPEAVF
jgi:hypothetical protein